VVSAAIGVEALIEGLIQTTDLRTVASYIEMLHHIVVKLLYRLVNQLASKIRQLDRRSALSSSSIAYSRLPTIYMLPTRLIIIIATTTNRRNPPNLYTIITHRRFPNTYIRWMKLPETEERRKNPLIILRALILTLPSRQP
jgi:hypothetical protein